MKLRVRSGRRTERIDLGTGLSSDKTLGDLSSCVEQCFGLETGSFQLSLNGQDPIEGTSDRTLKSFDIVSGDLIKVILPDSASPSDTVQTVNGMNAGRSASNSDTAQLTKSLPKSYSDTVMDEAKASSSAKKQKSASELSPPNSTAPLIQNGKTNHHGNTDTCSASEMSEEERQARERLAQLDASVDDADRITEPMLCRDSEEGKIPLRLKQLCDEAQPRNATDALCIALHVLMVETGFYAQENKDAHDKTPNTPSEMDCTDTRESILDASSSIDSQVQSDASVALPSGWRMGTSYRSLYQHPECIGNSCSLACVAMGSTLLIHGMMAKQIQKSIQLEPSTYVSLTDGEVTYQNLALLSRSFKDGVVYPLLAAMRADLGLPPLNGLLALFPEIQLTILSYLDLVCLVNMSTVCHHFHSLTQDMSLWRQLLLRDFGGKVTDKNCNWKGVYREKYRLKKMREQLRSRIQASFYPPGRRPFAFMPTMPNPLPGIYPPGYRGGEFDLDPFGSGGALPGFRHPGLLPNPSPLVPGHRHDPIFPNPDADFTPGHGGLRDLELGGLHQQHGLVGPSSRRLGSRTFGGGGRRGFIM